MPINLLFDLFSNAPLWSLFVLCVRINEFVSLGMFGVVLRQKCDSERGRIFLDNFVVICPLRGRDICRCAASDIPRFARSDIRPSGE